MTDKLDWHDGKMHWATPSKGYLYPEMAGNVVGDDGHVGLYQVPYGYVPQDRFVSVNKQLIPLDFER